ncbi:MAG: hypothetical protein WCO60_10405 [Verrucomicrobiota bacterium]
MLKKILLCAVLAFTVGTAFAKNFELPEKSPVLSVNIPDSWKPEEIEKGVHAQSPDDGVYLSIESARSEKGMDAILKSTFEMLEEHKVVIKQDSQKSNKFELAGAEAEELTFTGKDEDGAASISITIVPIGKSVFIITYWATTEKAEKNQAAINKIVKSMKQL